MKESKVKWEEILKVSDMVQSVFLLLFCVVFRLCALLHELLQRGGRGKNFLLYILSLSLGAFLHKLLDLQWKPSEFVLVFLIQVVLKLWTQGKILPSTGNQNWALVHIILKRKKVCLHNCSKCNNFLRLTFFIGFWKQNFLQV